MSSKPFSTRSALNNDFNLTVAFIVPLVLWLFFLLSRVCGGTGPSVLIVAIAGTVLSPLLTWFQLRKLRAAFESGIEVPGELARVYLHQDRGRLDFTFTLNDQKYSGSAAIHKNNLTRDFTVGQPVTVIVDLEKPERALLADLYINKVDE